MPPKGKSVDRPKLLAVQPLLKKHLWLEYEGERERVFDVSPYIKGKWFGELEDEDYFKQVRLSPDVAGVEWPHGQDIAPHELYEKSETLLQRKYVRIIDLFAQKANISKEEALDFFYSSVTYQLMSKGIADSHCLSDDYLAEDLVMELARQKENKEMKNREL